MNNIETVHNRRTTSVNFNEGGHNMSKPNAWEAKSWEELQELVELADVLKALKNAEQQRVYHKTQYLKRQAILKIAKQMVEDGRLVIE